MTHKASISQRFHSEGSVHPEPGIPESSTVKIEHRLDRHFTVSLHDVWGSNLSFDTTDSVEYFLNNLGIPGTPRIWDLFTDQALAVMCTKVTAGSGVIRLFNGQTALAGYRLITGNSGLVCGEQSGHLFNDPVDRFTIEPDAPGLSVDLILGTRLV